ncbi:DUF2948 family protein [Gellertiella hungarica]|uniref:DUF2948 domain-containing protein n=1 Tax=Gellertiella hungarica TaxID=1572859 RepID=A0A7W6J557_9HYPH|nr:DUF2948 family protein [Gellertiella hungarica]MBB4064083.1 hypothetical protein [Gellertiella hungarica]
MSALKLLALDTDDLSILSAHLQDSVLKVGDLTYSPRTGVFAAAVNRFAWETAGTSASGFERRRAALSFKRVKAVRSMGFDRTDREAVLALLAIRFEQRGDGPEGTVELVLAGGGAIALDVECIEGQLADTGGAWETKTMPQHPLDG